VEGVRHDDWAEWEAVDTGAKAGAVPARKLFYDNNLCFIALKKSRQLPPSMGNCLQDG
jgi:hypothetical protein